MAIAASSAARLMRCADASCVWVGQLQFVPEGRRGPTKSNRLFCLPDTIKLFAEMEVRARMPEGMDLPHLAPAAPKSTPLPFGTKPDTWQQVRLCKRGVEVWELTV